MFTRNRIALVLALLLSLIWVVPAFAGGWAIITLDEMPMNVRAGEPLEVGFTVLQHGETPMTGLAPTISAALPNQAKFIADAKPDGKPGHYTATLTFPKEGDWYWSIQAFTMDQAMPTLSVGAPVTKAASQPVEQNTTANVLVSFLPFIRIAAFGIGLAGLAYTFRRKSRLALVLTVFCWLVGVGSFVIAPAVPSVEAQSKSSSEIVDGPSISQVEFGRQLFIAKGCITCHVNEKASKDASMSILKDAPNLSSFSASPEALRLRLKDPSAVKSDTWMPDLDLSDVEIEALIAFINSK